MRFGDYSDVMYIVHVRHVCFLLFCILAAFVYLYDFSTIDCFNLAFVLQDFNKRIHTGQC